MNKSLLAIVIIVLQGVLLGIISRKATFTRLLSSEWFPGMMAFLVVLMSGMMMEFYRRVLGWDRDMGTFTGILILMLTGVFCGVVLGKLFKTKRGE